MSQTLPELLLSRFRGREDTFAFSPDGGKTFRPQQAAPSVLTVERHLSGHTQAGFYLVRPDQSVYCWAIDCDNHGGDNPRVKEQARKIEAAYDDFGIPCLMEVSQSGTGFHIWAFTERPIPAADARKIAYGILGYADLKGIEVYPRQDSVSPEKPLGSLIRYPLTGESRFLKPASDETWEPLQALQSVRPLSIGEIQQTLDRVQIYLPSGEITDYRGYETDEAKIPTRVHQALEAGPSSLLFKRWHCDASGLRDGSMSSIVLSIATQLVRAMIPTPEIEVAVKVWSRQRNYEQGQRDDWVKRTVATAYNAVTRLRERREISGRTLEGIVMQYADMLLREDEITLSTGIDRLDESIVGLAFSELTIVAARPSHGKSAILIQVLDHLAAEGYPTLLLSREMSAKEYSRRMLLRQAEVPEEEWRTERGNAHLKGLISHHFRDRAPMYFLEVDSHIDRVEEAIDYFCTEYGVRAVGLDYQGLCSWKGNEYEDQTEITKRLKQAARRNDIAMISLVQLRRPQQDRADWEPSLSQLRSSGEIENSADVVIAGKWPWQDRQKGIAKEEYLLYPLKNRNRGIKVSKIGVKFDSVRQVFV